jgi:hypothetical protein
VGGGGLVLAKDSCQWVVNMTGFGGNSEGCCVLSGDGGGRWKSGAAVVCRSPREFSLSVGGGRTFMICLGSTESGRDRRDVRGCCEPIKSFRG